MSDLDASVRPRRTVIDLKPVATAAPSGRKRRRNRGKKRNRPLVEFTEQPALNDGERDLQQQVPLEMAQLVHAAIDYGRKTHAMGALSATQALSNITAALKKIVSEQGSYNANVTRDALLGVIAEAEAASQKIFNSFATAYEPEHSS